MRVKKSAVCLFPWKTAAWKRMVCVLAAAAASWQGGFSVFASDTLTREIDGCLYSFRCIDRNYFDEQENHPQMALYLCETVIPANFGSDWVWEVQADGTYGYSYHAGPIVNFGSCNDYKYSNIRRWLEKNSRTLYRDSNQPSPENYEAEIGVSRAFTGSTAAGKFSRMNGHGLVASPIGYQKLNGELFILSVEEAVRYKEELWRFDGSMKDNPEAAEDGFCNAYWLRTPCGDSENHDTGLVYVVDLEQGNLHPHAICPEGDTGDEELDVTTDVGVRPVFLMPVK